MLKIETSNPQSFSIDSYWMVFCERIWAYNIRLYQDSSREMYGRNNIFQSSSSGANYNNNSTQYNNQNRQPSIGSYRTEYRYDPPNRDLTSAVPIWSTYPPASILARE